MVRLVIAPPAEVVHLLDPAQFWPVLVGLGIAIALLGALVVMGFDRRG